MIKNSFGVILIFVGVLIIIGLLLYWAWTTFGLLGFLIAIAATCLIIGHNLIGD